MQSPDETFSAASPVELSERIFNRMFEKANLGTMTNEERKQYDYEMTTEIDKIAQLEYARKEGRKERSMEIAKNLLEMGIPVEKVASVTNLPVDQVMGLIQKS